MEDKSIVVSNIMPLGQTSDHISDINNYVLPQDYKWDIKPSDIKSFFTFEDFVYLLQEGQKEFEEFKENIKKSSIYSRCGRLFRKDFRLGYLNIFPCFACAYTADGNLENVYDEVHFSFGCYFNSMYSSLEYSLSEIMYKGYEFLLSEIKRLVHIYDFLGDLSIVPDGVNEMFAHTLEKIDKEKDNIQTSFVWLSVYLHDLVSIYDRSNILAYGCKDIYEFAEKRFDFGRTSVKNFLAIYDNFINGVNIKPAFKNYSYSQLTELVSVPAGKLSYFSSDMTVKEIREKKKEILKPVVEEKAAPSESKPTVAEPVKPVERQLNEGDVLSIIDGIENPYFVEGKEKQSARYDAYEKAINDILSALHYKLGCASCIRVAEV